MTELRPVALLACACCLLVASPLLAQQSAEEQLRSLQLAEGLEAQLFAAEPMVVNPAAIDIDTHGRVWVAEIQWYRRAAKLPPQDKIKVLEDTDGDGRADRVTVFADSVFCPMSICVAGTKVYVATSPDLWVYEDADGDLKADGPPQKLLTGFGGFNHDHSAHSLVLGPDHKWWMAHGDHGFDVTGADGSQIEYEYGAMLRGELDGSQLEIVARNFRNPYEVCVSSFGEAICSDNDNDGNFSTRICWIMEGGDYGWFGRPGPKFPPEVPFSEAWHFRGPTPGFVPSTLVTGFGSPCGICFYEGDALGERYKNMPWHTDNGPREVRVYPHQPHGAGMRAEKHNVVTTDDMYFRPDDVCAAPDGTLYIADWYDGGVGGHAYNNPGQGRIFRIVAKGNSSPQRVGKPGPYSSVADALKGLKSPNLATQYLARERLLAGGEESVAALKSLLGGDEPNFAARALWVLDRLGGEARVAVLDELSSDDVSMRALAVRILRRHGAEYQSQLLPLAKDDSAEVRREVLLAMRHFEGNEVFAVLVKLAQSYEGDDRYLLEAINIAAGDRKQQLGEALRDEGAFSLASVQLLQLFDEEAAAELLVEQLAVAESDAERMAALVRLAGLPASSAYHAVLHAAADSSLAEPVRRRALELAIAGSEFGWQPHVRDGHLETTCRALLADARYQREALQLAADYRLRGLAKEVLAIIADETAPLEVRAQAIEAAGAMKLAQAAALIEPLLASGPRQLQPPALLAMVALEQWDVVLALLADGDPSLAAQAAEHLMSSTGGALSMLQWIREGKVGQAARGKAIELALNHPDANVRTLYIDFVPEDQRPVPLGEGMKAEDILGLAGDPIRGADIFFRSSAAQCKNCHMVNGAGKPVGPDLSAIGKKYERAALLETILQPSKAIGPEFISYLLVTTAGQVHAGFLLEKTERFVTLKDIQNRRIRVPADEVELLEAQEKSVMPELVLKDITAQDAADLLAYLVSLKEPGGVPIGAAPKR